MTTNEGLYKSVLDILRKDIRGEAVSVAEFNALLPVVSHEYFSQQYAKFQQTQKITDSLAPFIKTATITLTSGVGYLPRDYMHMIGKPLAGTARVDMVSRLEYDERSVDYITQPTTTYPVAVIGTASYSSYIGTYSTYTPELAIFGYTTIAGVSRPTILFDSGYNYLNDGDLITISGGRNSADALAPGYDGTHEVKYLTANSVYLPNTTYDNTLDFALFTVSGRRTITAYPTSITSVAITYLARPATPKLDYYVTMATNVRTFLAQSQTHTADTDAESYPVAVNTPSDGGTYTSETQEMEWGPQDRPSILALLMTKLGVTMGQQGVAEYGMITTKTNDK